MKDIHINILSFINNFKKIAPTNEQGLSFFYHKLIVP